MKTVAATLQVARSNIIERRDGSRPQRGPQNRADDVDLVADIRRLVDQRPTYGYRRIAALLKRERRSAGRQPVNAKRIFRLMKKHGLLLQRYTGRRRPGEHDGKIITIRSNIRWCADAWLGRRLWRLLAPYPRPETGGAFSRLATSRKGDPSMGPRRPSFQISLTLPTSEAYSATAPAALLNFPCIYQSRMCFPVTRFRPTQFTPQSAIARRPGSAKR